jgi:photosystem II stability/assembly factor-like uncharacterized protein
MTERHTVRRRNPPALLIVALGSILLPPTAGAQPWIPVGPPGGDVRSLAVDPLDPQRIYLGTAEGVLYRSDVGGLVWQRQNPGFPRRGQSLDTMVVGSAGTLLVGFWDVRGQGGGVALSADRGRTFTVAAGIEGESVRALALAPSDPRMAVAGTLSGVFTSRDGGRSWRRISPEGHPELRNIESVTIDPRDPQVIYVGSWHLPWKTHDGGGDWRPLHGGMIDDSDVFTLTLDRRDPQRVFATACSGIYRSTPGALPWTRVRGIPSSSRRTLAFAQDRLHPDSFYAGTTEGLWVSDDDTESWRLATARDIVVNALAALPDGTLLLGAEGAGVLRSRDRGRTWASSNAGFSERFVSRIVFDSFGKRVLVGVWGDRYHGGVLTAPNSRGPWTRLGIGLAGREILSLAVADTFVLAGTDEGLFSLRLQDTVWRRLTFGVGPEPDPRITDVAVVPRGVLLAATPLGVFRSGDAGQSWRRTSTEVEGPVSSLATSPDDPRMVLLATRLGLWMSSDAGTTWRSIGQPGDAQINTVALLPGQPRLIFAASSDGLYRSVDLGRSWTYGGWGLPHSDLTGLAVHPDGRTVYVSDFKWGGVYRTENRGQSWTKLTDIGLASDRVWTVGLDPASPDELLAASVAGGLHLFTPRRPSPARTQPTGDRAAIPSGNPRALKLGSGR